MSDSAIWTRNGVNDARLVRNFSYVNGKWTAGDDGATVAVTNPADGVTLGDVASLSRLVDDPTAGPLGDVAALVRPDDREQE